MDPALLAIVGRLLLGGLFVAGGARHLLVLPALTGVLAARGVPYPKVSLILGSVIEIAAGLALMAGVFVPAAAAILIAFTIAASILMLNFWDLEGDARHLAISVWMSNCAIVGGLLLAVADALPGR